MVVADQVKDTVHQEAIDFLGGGEPVLGGLALRSLEGDDDVAESVPDLSELPFLEGEGENVGRTVLTTVLAVEAPDAGVVGQENRELRPAAGECLKNRPGLRLKVAAPQPAGRYRSAHENRNRPPLPR